jgi:hypothetical protein
MTSFKMLDDFIAQKQNIEAKHAEMLQRESDAFEAYVAKRTEYERTITRSVTDGKDLTRELDKIEDELTKAQSAYKRRQEEMTVFKQSRPLEKISAQDVVDAFNGELVPTFKKERFDSVLAQLLKTKYEYAKAEMEYYSTLKEFEGIRLSVKAELGDHYQYKLQSVDLKTMDESKKYLLKDADLKDMAHGLFPTSLKDVKKEELKTNGL